MFQLDDKFLEDLGLQNLPDEQKQAFLQHIYEQLELRVGTKLSEGLSDSQLEEFEKIIDRDSETIKSWLENNVPDFRNDNAFKQLQQNMAPGTEDTALRAEFAATKWLEVNRPDYRQVVAQVLDELKQEISTNRDAILG